MINWKYKENENNNLIFMEGVSATNPRKRIYGIKETKVNNRESIFSVWFISFHQGCEQYSIVKSSFAANKNRYKDVCYDIERFFIEKVDNKSHRNYHYEVKGFLKGLL